MKKLASSIFAAIFGLLFCLSAATGIRAQTPPVFGPEKLTRAAGAPQVITRTFSVQDTIGDFTLIIQNGEDGAGRASSAVVELNGFQVAGPSDFNQQTGQVVKSVGCVAKIIFER